MSLLRICYLVLFWPLINLFQWLDVTSGLTVQFEHMQTKLHWITVVIIFFKKSMFLFCENAVDVYNNHALLQTMGLFLSHICWIIVWMYSVYLLTGIIQGKTTIFKESRNFSFVNLSFVKVTLNAHTFSNLNINER